ncbi:MAG: TIM barrel protein [Actinomycetota bacterium]
MAPSISLGTVALEPTRWARGPQIPAPIALSPWLDALADAGFDGLELWERHLTDAAPDEVDAVLGHRLPITVFNTYVSLDDPDPTGRRGVAEWVATTGARGVKFNVGRDEDAELAYVERLAAWLEELPRHAALLCECHHGISIAEYPDTAARIFAAVGEPERLGAIVHTHESVEHLERRFDAYGDRIRHVHVNYLELGESIRAPRLADVADDLARKVDLFDRGGFDGTWSIEFVHGLQTDADQPERLVAQAIEDLEFLRSML